MVLFWETGDKNPFFVQILLTFNHSMCYNRVVRKAEQKLILEVFVMNVWHELNPERVTPQRFDAYIEIPKGSKSKYELDKETGLLRLDRILHTSTRYPANYGLIPLTFAQDLDPLDVLVLCSETVYPGILIECYPIGYIRMIDSGYNDEKIIAIPFNDPNYNIYTDISQLPPHIFREMCHFFSVYKTLEQSDKYTKVQDVKGASEAQAIIAQAIKDYKKTYGGVLKSQNFT